METVVDIVGNEEVRDDDITLQETADPVVYQLVRVDGNGRLVPATEDEVMAVEDLLDDDKIKIRSPDSLQTLECSKKYGSTLSSSNIAQLQGSEGQPQPEVLQDGAGEPNMSPNPPMGVVEVDVDVQHEERISSLDSKASGGNVCQSGSPDACSKLSDGSNEIKSSNSTSDSNLRPDFSLLNGEIHLENLSVRDLQETFKATFGRETSVKDKQWLKRRIIMGLTNSCDFSTTTLVIIDNRVVKEVKAETCQSVESSVLVDCAVTSAVDSDESPITCHDKQTETHLIDNGMIIQSSGFQDNCDSKDADTEERPAKRVRKPTKRYIEELSEGEPRDSGAKEVSSGNHHGYDQPSAKVCSRPFQNFGLEGRCFTRMDSLGGSGVQVPYVSRIRRSRPRENFMTLMPSGIGISTTSEKNNFGSNKQLDNDAKNKTTNSLSPRWIQEPLVTYSERCNLETEKKAIQLEKEIKLRNMESYKTSSDDEVVTVPTANGGMRRKHHRPWTLGEVVKLVEGVAKYGAGRWSEIKRLAFASYSYRTSVDLKDKWRNLLRASIAEAPTGNGMNNSRKQASVAIPAPILSRVRELADMQTQVQPSFSSSKLAAHND